VDVELPHEEVGALLDRRQEGVGDAGIVHQHVEPPHPPERCRHHRHHRGLGGHVAAEREVPLPQRAGAGLGRFGPQVGDDHAMAAGGEAPGDRPADSIRPAGHQGDRACCIRHGAFLRFLGRSFHRIAPGGIVPRDAQ
jgi:hypothetical protein